MGDGPFCIIGRILHIIFLRSIRKPARHLCLCAKRYAEMGETMDKKSQKRNQEQQSLNKFNSITQKDTPENQNQTHNSRKEGIQPINQKR